MDYGRTTRELLADEGMTASALRAACEQGQLERVRRGHYAPKCEPDEVARHRRLIAATFPLLAEGSVLSHTSAAVLHKLPVRPDRLSRIWVTRPGDGHGRHGPVVHLRRSSVADSDVDTIDGWLVTGLARTAIDLARELPFEWGVVGLDAALASGCDREALAEVLGRMGNWPGTRRANAATRFADGASGSPAESLSRVQMHQLGLPAPITQFRVVLNGVVVATTDFGWDEYGLVGECDGKVKYGELLRPGETPADAVMREKRREERIRQAGYWIVRWGWYEACHPAELARVLRRGFELAPGRPQSAPRTA